jgi:hypothetical protein
MRSRATLPNDCPYVKWDQGPGATAWSMMTAGDVIGGQGRVDVYLIEGICDHFTDDSVVAC